MTVLILKMIICRRLLVSQRSNCLQTLLRKTIGVIVCTCSLQEEEVDFNADSFI